MAITVTTQYIINCEKVFLIVVNTDEYTVPITLNVDAKIINARFHLYSCNSSPYISSKTGIPNK